MEQCQTNASNSCKSLIKQHKTQQSRKYIQTKIKIYNDFSLINLDSRLTRRGTQKTMNQKPEFLTSSEQPDNNPNLHLNQAQKTLVALT
jgi:hypothetical protein